MNSFAERKSSEKRESQQNDPESVKVVRFPREVKILGNISRVYVEGSEKHEKLIFERDQASGSRDSRGEKPKNYIIIPVKDGSSDLHFVKAPIYKLSRKPKAQKLEDAKCQKLNPFGEETTFEDIPKWSADKSEIYEWKELSSSRRNETLTVFTFQHTGRNGMAKLSEYQGKPMPLAIQPEEEERALEEAEKPDQRALEQEEPEEPEDAPPLKRLKSKPVQNSEVPRLLKYLITLKGRNKLGKRFKRK